MLQQQYPLVTVGGFIVADDGDILLVRSKKWSNCFTCPGGKVELGETRQEAFIREMREETRTRSAGRAFRHGSRFALFRSIYEA